MNCTINGSPCLIPSEVAVTPTYVRAYVATEQRGESFDIVLISGNSDSFVVPEGAVIPHIDGLRIRTKPAVYLNKEEAKPEPWIFHDNTYRGFVIGALVGVLAAILALLPSVLK